jgi:hypothetical protein
MDALPQNHDNHQPLLETDIDAACAEDDEEGPTRRRHASAGTKARVVKPGEGYSREEAREGEEEGKAVRGRRKPLYTPNKTGTFTRPKPSPELAAMRSRIPDVSDDSSSNVSVDSSTFTRSRSR